MGERVIIVDDHPIFRRGLRDVLEREGRFEVVGEAGTGPEALRLIRECKPALVVLDIAMPEADGLDVLAQATRWPDAPAFIMLTMYDERPYFRQAFELGARGYLLKEHAEEELVRCLDTVSAGKRYVGTGMPWRVGTDGAVHVPDPLEPLSPAERRILKLVGDYKSSKEIAALLNVSIRTVENHRANIAAKLNLHGPNALLRFALDHSDAL